MTNHLHFNDTETMCFQVQVDVLSSPSFYKGHDKPPSIYFKEESQRQKQDGAIAQQISV